MVTTELLYKFYIKNPVKHIRNTVRRIRSLVGRATSFRCPTISIFQCDAVHLSYASYYDIQYLHTWNCNHLANANKRKHIRVINGRLGLSTPEIVTPLELFKEEYNT